MKDIVFFSLFVFILSGISCKENVALEYENDPALYFANEQYGQRDSISHSFMQVPGDGPDTVYVEIRTMGMISGSDRPFVLEQSNTGKPDAAVAGVHYVAFDDPEMAKYFKIPANSAKARLPVILLRDKSLEEGQVRLELKIVPNEYFHPGIPQWTHFLVKTTAMLTKPRLWNELWSAPFGDSWGPVKMKFIIDVTGLTDWETLPDIGYTTYLRTKVVNALQQYNLANPKNPLAEADGTRVTF